MEKQYAYANLPKEKEDAPKRVVELPMDAMFEQRFMATFGTPEFTLEEAIMHILTVHTAQWEAERDCAMLDQQNKQRKMQLVEAKKREFGL